MKNILIIDDNKREYRQYMIVAGRIEAEALIFNEASGALKALRNPANEIIAAVVLWDIRGTSPGPKLIAEIKSQKPDIPIIAINSKLDVNVAYRAQALGATYFLLKPIDANAFEAVLREILLPPQPEDSNFQLLKDRLIGQSKSFLGTLRKLAKFISDPNCRILLVGESGTGKELLAKAIHELGPHLGGEWVPVNIANIPEGLLEGHLFGYEEGAFTGANKQHKGYFEEARKGTLFLDEIGDFDINLQSKILRAIEESCFRRVGGDKDIIFDGGLVCATNKNLAIQVNKGRFRRDLYHRISKREVRIPPLRDRDDDIIVLARTHLKMISGEDNCKLARETISLLTSYPFLGNVRELHGILEQAYDLSNKQIIRPMDLPVEIMRDTLPIDSIKSALEIIWPEDMLDIKKMTHDDALKLAEHELNRLRLPGYLKDVNGKVLPAARKAKMDPKTFRKKWAECGLGGLSSREDNKK